MEDLVHPEQFTSGSRGQISGGYLFHMVTGRKGGNREALDTLRFGTKMDFPRASSLAHGILSPYLVDDKEWHRD